MLSGERTTWIGLLRAIAHPARILEVMDPASREAHPPGAREQVGQLNRPHRRRVLRKWVSDPESWARKIQDPQAASGVPWPGRENLKGVEESSLIAAWSAAGEDNLPVLKLLRSASARGADLSKQREEPYRDEAAGDAQKLTPILPRPAHTSPLSARHRRN